MGKLYQFPRDFSLSVVTTWIHGSTLFKAQFNGQLCPHFHMGREMAERCHRSLERSAKRMRLAQ